jgi:hypothetical protein
MLLMSMTYCICALTFMTVKRRIFQGEAHLLHHPRIPTRRGVRRQARPHQITMQMGTIQTRRKFCSHNAWLGKSVDFLVHSIGGRSTGMAVCCSVKGLQHWTAFYFEGSSDHYSLSPSRSPQ